MSSSSYPCIPPTKPQHTDVGAFMVTVKPVSGDNSTHINNAINQVKANGKGTVHLTSGTFLITSPIWLLISNIILEGEGIDNTVIKCGKSGIGMIYKDRATLRTQNIQVRNLTADGANISGKILNLGAETYDITVSNVKCIHHNVGNGPGVFLVKLHRALITHCIFANPNAQGDAVAIEGTDFTFRSNEIYRSVPGGGMTSGGLIRAEISYNFGHDSESYSYCSLENWSDFSDIAIHDNTFTNLRHGNAIHNNGYAATGKMQKIYIYSNKIKNMYDGAGVKLNAFDTQVNVITSDSAIYNNTITYTRYSGIYSGPLRNFKIHDNVISDCSPYGIQLFKGSSYVTMQNNVISGATNGKFKARYYFTDSSQVEIDGVQVA